MTIQAMTLAFEGNGPERSKFARILRAASYRPAGPSECAVVPGRGYRRPREGRCYVVGWRESGIVKVGIARGRSRRWETFLKFGAELLALTSHDDPASPEKKSLEYLNEHFPRAFKSPECAREFLGGRGAGFSECFLVPADNWDVVLSSIREMTA